MTLQVREPWRLPEFEIALPNAPLEREWLWGRVMPPPPEIAAHLKRGGLKLANARHADATLFAVAAAVIAKVPSLAAIVHTRVRSVHLLKADPGYDVSHSEPQWGDRIFVSVPERSDKVGALRLAEGVIHEALHVHLTELEAIAPLIADLTGTLPSPWRPELRSYGGVLHGAFVFACLKEYFGALPEHPDSPAGRHLRQRRAEIGEELSEIGIATLKAGLTKRGTALLSGLLGCPATVGSET